MHKTFGRIGLIALAGMLTASTVLAASHPRSAAVVEQPTQLAKDDAKAPAEQPQTKKKHKRSKKSSHGKDAAQGAPANK